MESFYDIIKVTKKELELFRTNSSRSKIGLLLDLVIDELPSGLKSQAKASSIYLSPIDGFEDKNVRGYEVVVVESKHAEALIKSYIPFFILKKP